MNDRDLDTTTALRQLHVAETDDRLLDRRRFLQLVGMGVGVGALSGAMDPLFGSIPGRDGATAWAAGPLGPTDGVLLVIGMYGGNDSLNTVVPFNDGEYYRQHGSLAIAGQNTLPISGSSGLHPELTAFKAAWDRGELAVVEGIGYPNPDLSHFNSLAYWMAGRPGGIPTTGWLGRWLDGRLAGTTDLFTAAEIGTSVPLQLIGAQQRGTAVPTMRPTFGASTDPVELRMFDAVRRMETASEGHWHRSVSGALADQLDLTRTVAPMVPELPPEGVPAIVTKLEIAARLINADLGFRVLTAGWADFDSHAGQPNMHGVRMKELNAAVERFFAVLQPGWHPRVTIMTISEFGRTSWSNDGAGTDHGTAATQFVIGRNVKGGWYGQRPSLAGLGRWDRMAHHVDFRSYYASVIDGWLGGGSSEVLGGNYENLGLFAIGPGGTRPAPGPAVVSDPSGFVPLTPQRIVDTRTGLGGPKRKLHAGEQIRVRVAGVAGVPMTGVTAVVANVTAVSPTEHMYFTVFPGSTTRPGTSNLNGQPGRPVPNLVVMGVGSDGSIEVFNSNGETHCLVDVFGYATNGGGDRFTPLRPQRLFDSRSGLGLAPRKIGGQQPVEIQVAGQAGVPPAGATAVVMNLTATQPDSAGFLRITPTGRARADTSNVNFAAGDTVPNPVICLLGDGGKVTLDADGAGTHVIGDVFGYFSADGGRLRAMPPQRVLDTRDGTGAAKVPIGPQRSVTLPIAGSNGVPASATAVVLNLTAMRSQQRSYVSVWPAGESDPGTSNLNVIPGRVSANLVICRLGAGGGVTIANPVGECDVIGDVMGYFVA